MAPPEPEQQPVYELPEPDGSVSPARIRDVFRQRQQRDVEFHLYTFILQIRAIGEVDL